jgi:hypothetical protein
MQHLFADDWGWHHVKVGHMTRKLTWVGLFIGSTLGNMVPLLWGGSAISMSGFLFSTIGGIAGIWVGYRFGQSL